MSDTQKRYNILLKLSVGDDSVYADESPELEAVLNDIFVAQTAKSHRNGFVSQDELEKVQRRDSNIMTVKSMMSLVSDICKADPPGFRSAESMQEDNGNERHWMELSK